MGGCSLTEPPQNYRDGQAQKPLRGIRTLGNDLGDNGGEDNGYNGPGCSSERLSNVHNVILAINPPLFAILGG